MEETWEQLAQKENVIVTEIQKDWYKAWRTGFFKVNPDWTPQEHEEAMSKGNVTVYAETPEAAVKKALVELRERRRYFVSVGSELS